MYVAISKDDNGRKDWIKFDADDIYMTLSNRKNTEIFISEKEYNKALYTIDVLEQKLADIEEILNRSANDVKIV